MPKFVIVRNFGKITPEELETCAVRSLKTAKEKFPQIKWEHSHVVADGDGLHTFCIYEAPNENVVRDHARMAKLPLDSIKAIVDTVAPRNFEGKLKKAA